MSIEFVGYTVRALASAGIVTIDKPSGVADGDILFTWYTRDSSAEPLSVPSGWTLIAEDAPGRARLYYRIADGEPSNYTWTWSSASAIHMVMCAYRGSVNIAEPIDTFSNGSYEYGVYGTTLRATPMMVSAADSVLLHFGWAESAANHTSPPVSPATFIEDVDRYGSAGILSVSHAVWPGSGNTGDIDATLSAAVNYKAAVAVALNSIVEVPFDSGTGQSASAATGSGEWTAGILRPYGAGPGKVANASLQSGSWGLTKAYSGTGASVSASTKPGGYFSILPPEITGVSDDNMFHRQYGVVIRGTDFVGAGATVELSNSSVYESGAKVSQLATYQDDEEIRIVVNAGGFEVGTPLWLYVTTRFGRTSAGWPVNLVEYSATPEPLRRTLDCTHFMSQAMARYDLKSFGNDTVTPAIWEMKDGDLDMIPGDGQNPDTYPVFSDTDGGYYLFDGVDAYFDGWPEMPDKYTVVVAVQEGADWAGWDNPELRWCNDSTIKDYLTVPGAFAGKVFGMIVFPWELSQLELFFIEQYMLRRVWRDTYIDPFTARLIRSAECALCFYFEDEADRFVDYSGNSIGSTDQGTAWEDGLTFPSASSALVMDADSALNLDTLTIFLEAPLFDTEASAEAILQNGTNYALGISRSGQTCTVTLNGSSFAFSAIGYRTLAVSASDGETPRFYMNGQYAGDGDSPVTLSPSAGQLTVGNNTTRNNPFASTLKKLSIYSVRLSDAEIRAAHFMAMTERNFNE